MRQNQNLSKIQTLNTNNWRSGYTSQQFTQKLEKNSKYMENSKNSIKQVDLTTLSNTSPNNIAQYI